MQVTTIPCLADNYAYIINDHDSKIVGVVDPSESDTDRVISSVIFSIKDVGVPISILLYNTNHEGRYCDEIVKDSLSTSSTKRVKVYSLSSVASGNNVVKNIGGSFIGSISNVNISLSESTPSVTATETWTSPKKFVAGVIVKILSIISPEASPETIVSKYTKSSPSISFADN